MLLLLFLHELIYHHLVKSYIRNPLSDIIIRHVSINWGIKQILGKNHEQIKRDDPIRGVSRAAEPPSPPLNHR